MKGIIEKREEFTHRKWREKKKYIVKNIEVKRRKTRTKDHTK
jgi:hypothetical protein